MANFCYKKEYENVLIAENNRKNASSFFETWLEKYGALLKSKDGQDVHTVIENIKKIEEMTRVPLKHDQISLLTGLVLGISRIMNDDEANDELGNFLNGLVIKT